MDTKENILVKALGLFAEKGFAGVTVREICTAAGANVALVNYHFHNKEGLYRACVQRIFESGDGRRFAHLVESVRDAASWRAAITEWVTLFSKALHAPATDSYTARFFRHEVITPSNLHALIRRKYVQPVLDELLQLLAMAVEDAEERFRYAASIWAQVSAFALVDPIWQPLFRPKGAKPLAWGAAFADFVCKRIFGELAFSPKLYRKGMKA